MVRDGLLSPNSKLVASSRGTTPLPDGRPGSVFSVVSAGGFPPALPCSSIADYRLSPSRSATWGMTSWTPALGVAPFVAPPAAPRPRAGAFVAAGVVALLPPALDVAATEAATPDGATLGAAFLAPCLVAAGAASTTGSG